MLPGSMQAIRLYDPARVPENWRDIIRPGQFAAFAADVVSGAACDDEGEPFASSDAVTCLIFDSLQEAETLCRERVARHPQLRFDIFDAAGRTQPPIITVVHESRSERLEGNRGSRRLSNVFAACLLALAPVLIWFDWSRHDGLLIVPTVVAINCIVFAARIVFLNLTYVSIERAGRQRLAKYHDRGNG